MKFKYMDKWLLVTTTILFAIGLIMIFSASNVSSYMRYNASPYKYLIKQVVNLFVGIVASICVIESNTKVHSLFSWLGMIVIPCCLIYLLMGTGTYNGAKSWMDLKIIGFQPSELMKIVMIVWMASYYETKKDTLNKYSTTLVPLGAAIGIFVLILVEPDLGTGAIFLGIALIMFFLSKVDSKIKAQTGFIVLGLGIIGCFAIYNNGESILSARQYARLSYRYPCSTEKFYADGNQVCNSYIAINNGGLMGKGLGNSTQKYLYLPEAHTDFIFAIVVEELGLVVSLFILLLMFIVIWRIIMIGRNTPNNRKALICYGIAAYILFHIIVNLTGITGALPMTGVPLPFLSYGGTFTICLLVALAIVQRINIENNLNKL